MPIETDDGLRRVLEYDRIAVVGASTDYAKAAHIVPAYLQRHGYEVIPINPFADAVFGVPAADSLSAAEGPIDVVEVFRPDEEVPGIVDAAIDRGDAVAIWLQPGIHHDEAVRTAEEAGLDVLRGRCMKSEHGRLVRHPFE